MQHPFYCCHDSVVGTNETRVVNYQLFDYDQVEDGIIPKTSGQLGSPFSLGALVQGIT